MDVIEIEYVSDVGYMAWNGSEASSPLLIWGDGGWGSTPYQTADARHRTGSAVRLVAELLWGPLYETAKKAEADGRGPADEITIWDEVSYRPVG